MVSPAPVKSQSLHNFVLPLWNCSKNQHITTTAHTHVRSRKATAAAATPESTRRSSPLYSDSESRRSAALDGLKNGYGASSEKSERKSAADGRSKILIRFRTKNKGDEEGGRGDDEAEEEEKTWNLRPRRSVCKRAKGSGEATKTAATPESKKESPATAAAAVTTPSRPEWLRCRNNPEARVAEKEKAKRLSIPLSKDEIEEDIFVMTGSKPLRRPKKRARIVQRQLDSVFPGLWLGSVTPDSYKVNETPAKG